MGPNATGRPGAAVARRAGRATPVLGWDPDPRADEIPVVGDEWAAERQRCRRNPRVGGREFLPLLLSSGSQLGGDPDDFLVRPDEFIPFEVLLQLPAFDGPLDRRGPHHATVFRESGSRSRRACRRVAFGLGGLANRRSRGRRRRKCPPRRHRRGVVIRRRGLPGRGAGTRPLRTVRCSGRPSPDRRSPGSGPSEMHRGRTGFQTDRGARRFSTWTTLQFPSGSNSPRPPDDREPVGVRGGRVARCRLEPQPDELAERVVELGGPLRPVRFPEPAVEQGRLARFRGLGRRRSPRSRPQSRLVTESGNGEANGSGSRRQSSLEARRFGLHDRRQSVPRHRPTDSAFPGNPANGGASGRSDSEMDTQRARRRGPDPHRAFASRPSLRAAFPGNPRRIVFQQAPQRPSQMPQRSMPVVHNDPVGDFRAVETEVPARRVVTLLPNTARPARGPRRRALRCRAHRRCRAATEVVAAARRDHGMVRPSAATALTLPRSPPVSGRPSPARPVNDAPHDEHRLNAASAESLRRCRPEWETSAEGLARSKVRVGRTSWSKHRPASR